MSNLSVKIGNVHLKNPIMPASGTFSEDLAEIFDIDMLGAHVTKTITRDIRGGNLTPRVCEVHGSMLNSIGIPSKGVDAFKTDVLPFYQQYDTPLVVSVSAGTVDEFAQICEQLTVPGVSAIEVNISCPNIEADGKAFAMRASSTSDVIKRIRSVTNLPLWAKLTPNTGEIVEVALAAESSGADALVVSNTILAMAIDINTGKPKLGNLMGGLSGPSLKPISLRMAYQCAKAVNIPVIGCGGIRSVEDVIEYLMAGASAVQIGSETFINPLAMIKITQQLDQYMVSKGLSSLSELIGSVDDKNAADEMIYMEVAP